MELPVIEPITKKGRKVYRAGGGFLSTLFLRFNRLETHGLENKLEEGCCLIIGNHVGAAKDVAAIYRIYDRMLFFCASFYTFDKNYMNREIKMNYMRMLLPAKFPRAIMNVLLTPIRKLFVWYVSTRIKMIGTLPIRAEFLSPEERESENKKLKALMQAYLLAGRAIVLMQTDWKHQSQYHPYMHRFRKGAASMAYELFNSRDGLEVPLTPLSIYGSEGLLTMGKRIIVRIGEPLTIKPFIGRPDPVQELTDALERRVADMVRQDVEKHGMPKNKFRRHARQDHRR